MEASVEKRQFACEPLTMRGVAAFAGAPLGRLLVVQCVVALLAAASVVWFVHKGWFPTISEAIRQMPAEGEIRGGTLDWRAETPARLAEGRFLAFAVDLEHRGGARSPAHVQVEFGWRDLRVISLFGYVGWRYPKGRVAAFNREDLEPKWGAWAPPILWITAGVVASGLMVIWALLATVYCVPAWLIGFFADREVTLRGSWRLAGAALMPGALFMTWAILFYGLGALDVVHLLVAAAAHLVIGWVYVAVSPLSLPRCAVAAVPRNPFVHPGQEGPKNAGKGQGDQPGSGNPSAMQRPADAAASEAKGSVEDAKPESNPKEGTAESGEHLASQADPPASS